MNQSKNSLLKILRIGALSGLTDCLVSHSPFEKRPKNVAFCVFYAQRDRKIL